MFEVYIRIDDDSIGCLSNEHGHSKFSATANNRTIDLIDAHFAPIKRTFAAKCFSGKMNFLHLSSRDKCSIKEMKSRRVNVKIKISKYGTPFNFVFLDSRNGFKCLEKKKERKEIISPKKVSFSIPPPRCNKKITNCLTKPLKNEHDGFQSAVISTNGSPPNLFVKPNPTKARPISK